MGCGPGMWSRMTAVISISISTSADWDTYNQPKCALDQLDHQQNSTEQSKCSVNSHSKLKTQLSLFFFNSPCKGSSSLELVCKHKAQWRLLLLLLLFYWWVNLSQSSQSNSKCRWAFNYEACSQWAILNVQITTWLFTFTIQKFVYPSVIIWMRIFKVHLNGPWHK